MITRLSFAFWPQYLSFRTISTFWPMVHDLNLNGPVPVGCSNAYEPVARNVPFRSSPWSAPYFLIAVGLCITNGAMTSDGKNVPDDFRSLTMALYGPFAEQLR
jgi:hypothetical protein